MFNVKQDLILMLFYNGILWNMVLLYCNSSRRINWMFTTYTSKNLQSKLCWWYEIVLIVSTSLQTTGSKYITHKANARDTTYFGLQIRQGSHLNYFIEYYIYVTKIRCCLVWFVLCILKSWCFVYINICITYICLLGGFECSGSNGVTYSKGCRFVWRIQ